MSTSEHIPHTIYRHITGLYIRTIPIYSTTLLTYYIANNMGALTSLRSYIYSPPISQENSPTNPPVNSPPNSAVEIRTQDQPKSETELRKIWGSGSCHLPALYLPLHWMLRLGIKYGEHVVLEFPETEDRIVIRKLEYK
jgi:hypothetical protein